MKTLKLIGRALRHRNYRLFFIGQSISFLGSWIQQTALPWLIYSMTSSVFLLGVVGFLTQIPSFIFTPIAGVLVDRFDRRKFLLVTQGLAMIQAFVLWGLLVTHHLNVTAILILSFILGLINAFDVPARQSFVNDIVDNKEDLGNAIALNSTMVHAARLIGPCIAGFLIASTGEAVCFLVNALSFPAILTVLCMIHIKTYLHMPHRISFFKQMHEGFAYVRGHLPIKRIILFLSMLSFAGMPYMYFMPVFARDVFHGNSLTLGLLLSASGLGALGGAIYLATHQGIKGFGRLISSAAVLFSVGLMGFAISKIFWISWLCMVLVGFGMILQFAASSTVLQTIVDNQKRGRVMSLYALSFTGMAPLGSYLEGWLAHQFSVPAMLFMGGLICLLVSLNFARNLPVLREAMKPYRTEKIPSVLTDSTSLP